MVDQTCFYSKGAESVTWVWDLIMESVGQRGTALPTEATASFSDAAPTLLVSVSQSVTRI